MWENIVFGIFGDVLLDIIRSAVGESLNESGQNAAEQARSVIEKAAKSFFDTFGSSYGIPALSFLARPGNIGIIAKRVALGEKIDLMSLLSPKGYAGSKPVTPEAMAFFVSAVERAIKGETDTPAQKKEPPKEKREQTLNAAQASDNAAKPSESPKAQPHEPEHQIRAAEKEASPARQQENPQTPPKAAADPPADGKLYTRAGPDGVTAYMHKDGMTYAEITDPLGQKTYWETGADGCVKSLRLPYPLSQYRLEINGEQILSLDESPLPDGGRIIYIRLKWGRCAAAAYDRYGLLKLLSVHGEWGINHFSRIIFPLP